MKQQVLNNELCDLVDELLNEHHALSIRMQGFSMYPTLRPNDLGIVEKCQLCDLQIGDIAVFRKNKSFIAHRIISISSTSDRPFFIAKGDNNYQNDGAYPAESLVGKVNSFTRNQHTLKSNSGWLKINRFFAIYLPLFFVFISRLFLRIYHINSKLKLKSKNIFKNFSYIISNSKKEFFINSLIAVLQGIVPFILLVCFKWLLDSISNSNSSQLYHTVFILTVTALVFLLNAILIEIRNYFSEKLTQSISRHIYKQLQSGHAQLNLSHFENPAEQDKIHRAVQEASFRPLKAVNEALTLIKSISAAIFLAALFISIRWYLIVIVLIAIAPGMFLRLKFSRLWYKQKEMLSTEERKMYYYNRVITGFPFAKEMRLFGYFNFFRELFTKSQDAIFGQKISLRKKEVRALILTETFAILLIFCLLGYIIFLKFSESISVGTVVLFFFAVQRGYSILNDFFKSFTQILEDSVFLNDFMFFSSPASLKATNQSINQHFSLEKEIKIENVSFSYDTSKREALKSINLTIPAGKKVAFVGANGSGKTTLIKLICGFYQAQNGQILFDGIDSKEIERKEILENITAVFQDFALYNLSVNENIQLGNLQAAYNPSSIQQAAQAAGISESIDQLPHGYSTLLGNLFAGGEELSIGQWQKMAIARAFYRNAPLILMDEPSSALDADSELEIINHLRQLADGKTAIIISHRLSTVQWADMIYLFHEGEIIESGTHQELINQKGRYYSLFEKSTKKS